MRVEIQLWVDGKRTMCREFGATEEENEAVRAIINEMIPGPVDLLKRLQPAPAPQLGHDEGAAAAGHAS